MFTNTLDLKWSTIKRWIASYSSLGAVFYEEEALIFYEETNSNIEEHSSFLYIVLVHVSLVFLT
jgi:hypothetical protein